MRAPLPVSSASTGGGRQAHRCACLLLTPVCLSCCRGRACRSRCCSRTRRAQRPSPPACDSCRRPRARRARAQTPADAEAPAAAGPARRRAPADHRCQVRRSDMTDNTRPLALPPSGRLGRRLPRARAHARAAGARRAAHGHGHEQRCAYQLPQVRPSAPPCAPRSRATRTMRAPPAAERRRRAQAGAGARGCVESKLAALAPAPGMERAVYCQICRPSHYTHS